MIPQIDFELGNCNHGDALGNFRFGAQLGHGNSGSVYRLEYPVSDDTSQCRLSTQQVVKMIPKEPVTSMRGLQAISNEVAIMKRLSSPKWLHPNIIKLHEVYHSETHILLRMEDGGAQNLFSYLRRLESRRFPLGVEKAKSIISQCTNGLCHLHLGAKVAHRDIKPENLIVSETSQGIIIKFCDFDLARNMPPTKALCRSVCGTFPFIAPEIMYEGPYSPFPTDIWSSGIVFLEIICCSQVALKAVDAHSPRDRAKQKATLTAIYDLFKKPGSVRGVLDVHLRPELTALKESALVTTLEDMLTVEVSYRATAETIQATSVFECACVG